MIGGRGQSSHGSPTKEWVGFGPAGKTSSTTSPQSRAAAAWTETFSASSCVQATGGLSVKPNERRPVYCACEVVVTLAE
jgi:hypothetical protein